MVPAGRVFRRLVLGGWLSRGSCVSRSGKESRLRRNPPVVRRGVPIHWSGVGVLWSQPTAGADRSVSVGHGVGRSLRAVPAVCAVLCCPCWV